MAATRATPWDVEGWKEIASTLGCSERTAQRVASRPERPAPTYRTFVGVVAVRASRVTDEMFFVAAKTLAKLVTAEDYAKGRIYPGLDRIREVSAAIAPAMKGARVADTIAGLHPVPFLRHNACSAAVLLFNRTHLDLVRVGISLYGLWPSKETYVSCLERGKPSLDLKPVMTWKTRIAQVKQVPEGGYVGYGCAWRATRATGGERR